jgi:hypothetical protein
LVVKKEMLSISLSALGRYTVKKMANESKRQRSFCWWGKATTNILAAT